MKAIVLVGGEGTRLRPLTYSSPKQMLPIVGTPMLERVLANLAFHGVSEVVLSLGYMPDRFIETYPEFVVSGLPVSYAVEPEPLDTAGAIRFAADHARVSETFVVVNGDVLTDLDLTALTAFHRSHGALATIALHPVDDPSRFGVVPTTKSGQVIAFVEKPPREEAPTNEINAGTYILEPSVLEMIEPNIRVSVERSTFPTLAANGMLYGLCDSSYWLDTGTPEAYLEAHDDILSGRRALVLDPPVSNGSWVHPSAQVDPTATLVGATVDRDCVVGAGAQLIGAVLLAGAHVKAGAVVRSSILGFDSVVGEGAQLNPVCVIGRSEVVEPHSNLQNERVGGPQ